LLSGVLLLDKPIGFSSTQALGKSKWLLKEKKAGHTGTLDPFATGLLPLVFGEATKFARFYLEGDKTYLATMRLGQRTDTGDNEGQIVASANCSHISDSDIDAACMRFVGPIQQVPPMYSALKRYGKPLYELARAGIEVDREARAVTVHSLSVRSIARGTDVIDVQFEVRVSKGTYIRVLAEDVGTTLECGAHLIELRRTQTNQFSIDQAITVTALEALQLEERRRNVLPIDCLVEHLPRISLTSDMQKRFSHGQAIDLDRLGSVPDCATGQDVAVYGADSLLGVAQIELINERRVAAPSRLLGPK
jgi:tRNA pseudouridine55 synthase